MRELKDKEIVCVSGGLYEGQCNANLASYMVATIGVATVTGPFGFAVFAVGWGIAAYQMQQCANDYYAAQYYMSGC